MPVATLDEIRARVGSDLGASPGTASIPGITVQEDAAWFDITLPLDLALDP